MTTQSTKEVRTAIAIQVNRFLALTVSVMCMSMVTVAAADLPLILSVRQNSSTLRVYEKFDLRIDLKTTYANPFDPDEVDLRAQF